MENIFNMSTIVKPKLKLMSTSEIMQKYGKPGPEHLTTIQLPYKMRIAWDPKVTISRMQCHEKVANKMSAVFRDILTLYTFDRIQRLGIDLFGGCYNFRKMRGGSDWSRHSWGIAVDLDPARNPLKATSKTAQFAKSEYKAMIDIFYIHGFVSLGREKNYDWMHFEIGS